MMTLQKTKKTFLDEFNSILNVIGADKNRYQGIFTALMILVIYFGTLILVYSHCNNMFKYRKQEILDEYYQIIFNTSLVKLNDILQRLPIDQGSVNTLINVEKSDITICHNLQCLRSNLFEFASVFDKYVPHFIQYKIDINKKLLHRNINLTNYDLEKRSFINDYNQLSISLSIDPKHLDHIHETTLKPFFIAFVSLTLTWILFFLLLKSLKKQINIGCENYYIAKLKKQEEAYKTEFKLKENELMKKIWNLEYSKEKDIELNYLFSEEINKLAMHIQNTGYENFNPKAEFLPYSIPLYRKTNELESISTHDLIDIFTSRFSGTEEGITLKIQSLERRIRFSSKAALYQIIYSIISNLIFILREQSNNKHEIKLVIKGAQKAAELYFEYNGFPIRGDQEILRISMNYLKKHTNPFLLNLNQVFSILRDNGFDCEVKYNDRNIIEILHTRQEKNQQKEDNVVLLSSFNRKNNV